MTDVAKHEPEVQTGEIVDPKAEKIELSQYADALVKTIKSIKPKTSPDDISKINVSQTVSFLAIVYEKVRNAVEYREDHLIRRAAIERILRRRLALNSSGKGESEDLLRELLWARYFPNGSLGEEDIKIVQSIIDKYLTLKKALLTGRDSKTQQYLFEFLIEFMTCEIEEVLSPEEVVRDASFTYFIYQTLRQKIKMENLTEEQKDAYCLVAIERTYLKNDRPYQRYHLFVTFYKPIYQYSQQELLSLASKLPGIFKKVDDMRDSDNVEKLSKFIKKQLPPFLILFAIIRQRRNDVEKIMSDKTKLWEAVESMCREKYQQVKNRLRNLALRSLIYIFLTKMALALVLEYPVSIYLYNEVNITSILINSLFPPFLMLVIILFSKLPGDENTQKIYQRIIDIIDADKTFETKIAYITKKQKVKKPVLVFGFTIFYSLTFIITLFIIYRILTFLHFNPISQFLFIFFVSVVSFFSYRVKNVANEYRLEEKGTILGPVGDFFFMPILSIGKFFSSEVARFNFFKLFFDFIIEAPYKLIIQVIEEWISFTRQRKEEIG